MIQLQGEYDCKVDAKGRFRLPSQLVRQLGEAKDTALHVNRGMERCLTLYPDVVWRKMTAEIKVNSSLFKRDPSEPIPYFTL